MKLLFFKSKKKKEKIISVLKGARRKFQNMAGYPPTKWNTYKTRQIDIQMWRKITPNTHSLPHRESFLICFQNVSNISHMSQWTGREMRRSMGGLVLKVLVNICVLTKMFDNFSIVSFFFFCFLHWLFQVRHNEMNSLEGYFFLSSVVCFFLLRNTNVSLFLELVIWGLSCLSTNVLT